MFSKKPKEQDYSSFGMRNEGKRDEYEEPLNLFWMDKDRLVYGPMKTNYELEAGIKEMLRTASPLTIIAGYAYFQEYNCNYN